GDLLADPLRQVNAKFDITDVFRRDTKLAVLRDDVNVLLQDDHDDTAAVAVEDFHFLGGRDLLGVLFRGFLTFPLGRDASGAGAIRSDEQGDQQKNGSACVHTKPPEGWNVSQLERTRRHWIRQLQSESTVPVSVHSPALK